MKKESIILASLLAALFLAGWLFSISKGIHAPGQNGPNDFAESSAAPSAARPADPGARLLEEARAAIENDDRQTAMATLYTLLDRHPKSAAVVQAENWIGQMNWQELMADRPGHGKVVHNVRRGDSLASIAKKYDTTIELVQAMNDIEGTMIRMGQGLYVCTNRFEVVSSPSSGRVRVMAGDRLFKSYPAGFARIDYSNRKRAENASGGQEPLRINGRYENPDLKEGGRTIPAGAPQNYLGAARLTIDQRRLSIHGSRPDDPIENFTGPGCIRMRNSDVMELFLILPLGTPVYFEP